MNNRDLLRREPQRTGFRTEEGFQEAHAAWEHAIDMAAERQLEHEREERYNCE